MLTAIRVQGFQSLRSVNFELAKYTVVVGPSSSGKSALTRALRLLCFAGRGTSFVSHGGKNAKVFVSFSDPCRLQGADGKDEFAIETTRGKDNTYEVFAPEISPSDPQGYTKLDGKVPEAVAKLINITELSFADQFDRPYLLSATGSEVARSLGELTEVTRIFAAVKEANRRKGSASSTLSTRKADLVAVRADIEPFKTLPTEVSAQTVLEQRWADIREGAHRAARLADAIARAEVSESALTALGGPLPPVPSLAEVDVSVARLKRYRELLGVWIKSLREQAMAISAIEELSSHTIPSLHTELHDVLSAAGECPTCGAKAEAWQLSTVG